MAQNLKYALEGMISSPDRKIIIRGFQYAFYKAKEIVEGEK